MILTANGKNVYVDELEALLMQHPRIRAAVVFEEDHHPAASLTCNLTEDEMQDYLAQVNDRLPGYKQIRRFYIKPDIPGGRIK